MRSFLIRDILSGAAINATSASPGGPSDTAANHQELLAAAAAQSLAATQARLLAKWAEHQQQQQLQASKYFEQLQQQHNHLNLNLITGTHAANLTNPTLTSSPQLYQQQQQYQQLLNSLSLNEHLKTQSHSHNHNINISTSASNTTTTSTVTRHDEQEDEDHELDNEDDDEQEEDEEIQVDADELPNGERKSTLPLSPSHQQERASGSNQDKLMGDGRQQMEAAQCSQLNSPLDALFQMTSSTFDTLKRGEKRKERSSDSNSNLATNKQNPKKKRKSRTAFTNSQIYELERRFRMQKYLSPTDRDEIAMTLNLSNAQVITWFQNRRAKMKRDVEEQRRDIETASLLNLHKTFLESFQALSQMKTTMNPKD